MSAPLSIAARDLTFAYQQPKNGSSFVLRVPSWQVSRGARVALFGPSGCGKSTVLNLVAGLLPVQQGHLEVEGSSLEKLSERRRRAHRISRIGFVFQDFPLIDSLDATENVLLPYRLHRDLVLDGAARDRAALLLSKLGLEGKYHRPPRRLSQGERQRVALARALVTEPKLVLADEPTAGLDPSQSAAVLDLLEGLVQERGVTLVLVSHDPALLTRFDEAIAVDEWVHSNGAGDAR